MSRTLPFVVVTVIALLVGASLVATALILRSKPEAPAAGETKPRVEETPASFVLHLDSSPPGATVLENGREIGLTPLDITVDHRVVSTGLRRKFVLRQTGFVLATHEQGDAPYGDVSVILPLIAEAPPRQTTAFAQPPPIKATPPPPLVKAPPRPPDLEIRKSR